VAHWLACCLAFIWVTDVRGCFAICCMVVVAVGVVLVPVVPVPVVLVGDGLVFGVVAASAVLACLGLFHFQFC